VPPVAVNSRVALTVSDVHKIFRPSRTEAISALRGVDLAVARGEVVAVIGPSGSGKSTLLRCINLLERPTTGRIQVGDALLFAEGDGATRREPSVQELRLLRRRVGMVFQGFNLFPNLTALQNVSIAQMRALRRSGKAADARSVELLAQVGLSDRIRAYPHALSGGEQQRVAIARALALDPEIMLFDEPTSAIDPELRVDVLRCIRELADSGMTMIVVTHELGFASQVANRVIFLDQGQVLESGTPAQLFSRPLHDRTKAFLDAVTGLNQA
jgi:polar amino acid transport system ATP-binding protein